MHCNNYLENRMDRGFTALYAEPTALLIKWARGRFGKMWSYLCRSWGMGARERLIWNPGGWGRAQGPLNFTYKAWWGKRKLSAMTIINHTERIHHVL